MHEQNEKLKDTLSKSSSSAKVEVRRLRDALVASEQRMREVTQRLDHERRTLTARTEALRAGTRPISSFVIQRCSFVCVCLVTLLFFALWCTVELLHATEDVDVLESERQALKDALAEAERRQKQLIHDREIESRHMAMEHEVLTRESQRQLTAMQACPSLSALCVALCRK